MDAYTQSSSKFGEALKAVSFLNVLLQVVNGVGGRASVTDKHLQGYSCTR
jgi:hypothetical protein